MMVFCANRWLACTAIVLLLSACVHMPTANLDPAKNNKASYNKDLKECQEDYAQTSSGSHIRQWIGCMNTKGWRE